VLGSIVVGGGASGPVMANSLSEDVSAPVLIIERGCSVFQNPTVYSTSAYGAAFRSAIDYAYHSAPQVYMGNKVLGGTSTISANGMSHTRAEDVQINAWQTKLVAVVGTGRRSYLLQER
jgi:choline dehydrogenase-like flavoprotein